MYTIIEMITIATIPITATTEPTEAPTAVPILIYVITITQMIETLQDVPVPIPSSSS